MPLKLIEVGAIKFNFRTLCRLKCCRNSHSCSLKRNVSTQLYFICHCTLNENWYFNNNLITRVLSDILAVTETLPLQLQVSRMKLKFIGNIFRFRKCCVHCRKRMGIKNIGRWNFKLSRGVAGFGWSFSHKNFKAKKEIKLK